MSLAVDFVSLVSRRGCVKQFTQAKKILFSSKSTFCLRALSDWGQFRPNSAGCGCRPMSARPLKQI